jgi:hypothetical protein
MVSNVKLDDIGNSKDAAQPGLGLARRGVAEDAAPGEDKRDWIY